MHCSCMKRKKVRMSGFDTNAVMDSVIAAGLTGGSAIASRKLGSMIPAGTLGTNQDLIVNIGKIVLGGLGPAFVPAPYKKYAEAVGAGFVAEAALSLGVQYALISGLDNEAGALGAIDNERSALGSGGGYRIIKPERAGAQAEKDYEVATA